MTQDFIRGLYTDVVDIRRRVFVEVSKLILSQDHICFHDFKMGITKIPYQIIDKDDATYRCCVYKERAIISERVRLAFGLPLWEKTMNGPLHEGIEEVLKVSKQKTREIVNVIPEACEKCPTKTYKVTDNCRKCLSHPCSVVCPVKAIDFNKESAIINQAKCIKCGKCQKACPYSAIINYDRPCAQACGVDAIDSDVNDRAVINHALCVNCGMCIVACPFGAIADKSEFSHVLIAIKEKKEIHAILAPSFTGQFGPLVKPQMIISAIKKMGFEDVIEVAYGADVATIKESREWYHKIKEEHQKFLGTSCCPAWVDMARSLFPDEAENISDSFTPMVATAKLIKEKNPEALVTFIGPCISKKSESMRPEVKDFVDFVITFEELASIFVAMEIDPGELSEEINATDASGSGRAYAVSGGVAHSLKAQIEKYHPDADVKIEKRDSLKECKKLLNELKKGILDANLLEGMACPNGCVGGPGIIAPIRSTSKAVSAFSENSPYFTSDENPAIKDKKNLKY